MDRNLKEIRISSFIQKRVGKGSSAEQKDVSLTHWQIDGSKNKQAYLQPRNKIRCQTPRFFSANFQKK
jgi:hypothetical protein